MKKVLILLLVLALLAGGCVGMLFHSAEKATEYVMNGDYEGAWDAMFLKGLVEEIDPQLFATVQAARFAQRDAAIYGCGELSRLAEAGYAPAAYAFQDLTPLFFEEAYEMYIGGGDLFQAETLFRKLGDYSDSAVLADMCRIRRVGIRSYEDLDLFAAHLLLADHKAYIVAENESAMMFLDGIWREEKEILFAVDYEPDGGTRLEFRMDFDTSNVNYVFIENGVLYANTWDGDEPRYELIVQDADNMIMVDLLNGTEYAAQRYMPYGTVR